MYYATGMLIDMLSKLPDINKADVSVLVLITTDGESTDPGYLPQLKNKMRPLLDTGRWTFVARVPRHASRRAMDQLAELGIPSGNIQHWETSTAGLQASTQVQTQAMTNYFRGRSIGTKATGSFYMDASKVDITGLKDITKEVSLYVVPPEDNGIEIRPFILRHRMEHLKGSAFYQLTKTEAKVQFDKQVLVRDRASGKIFTGDDARKMLGLPVGANQRVHPGDHKNFDIFIQSNSINRKLVGGTGVVYWKAVGTPFTAADLAYLGEKSPFYVPPATPPASNVVQLPPVPVSTTPTKSPIPVTPRQAGSEFFATREASRFRCAELGIPQREVLDHGRSAPKARRWQLPGCLITKALADKGLKKAA